MGPNGVGKTTFLRLAAGILRPSRGRVECPASTRPRIGLLLQADVFPQNESVRRFLRFFASVEQSPKRREMGEVEAQLEWVGLSDRAEARLGELSYGESRLAMLARALIGGPDILLLDEPTLGLDESNLERCLNVLHELRGGPAIVFVSNDLRQVERTCDRILVLQRPGSVSLLDLAQENAWVTRITVRNVTAGVESVLQELPGLVTASRIIAGRMIVTLQGRPEKNTAVMLQLFRVVEDCGGTVDACEAAAAVLPEMIAPGDRSEGSVAGPLFGRRFARATGDH